MSDVHCWLPGRGLGKKRERRAAFRIAGFQVLLLLSSYRIYLSIFSFDRTVLLSTIFIVKDYFCVLFAVQKTSDAYNIALDAVL